jgi:PAS domain S-box-containing protein
MNHKIEMMRKKVEGQLGSNKDGPGPKDSHQSEVLQEFMTVLEELQVADEELRTQNEELIAGRQALEEERRRYQELFDLSPDAYLVTNSMGVVLEANRTALFLFNIDYRFLIKKPLISFIPEANRRAFRRTIMSIDEMIDIEMTFSRRGKLPDFEAAVRIAPMSNPQGVLIGFRWIIRDITEQKQLAWELRVSQERFQKVFTNTSTGIALLKMNGQIAESNTAFQNLLQTTPEELKKEDLSEFVVSDDKPLFNDRLRRLFDLPVENTKGEIRFSRKDGSVFWGLISFSMMSQGEGSQPYAILIVEDITIQKQLTSERIEMHHRVIDSIEAERNNLARELHDNPLQTLNGALFLLVDIDYERLDDENAQKLILVRQTLRDVANSIRLTCSDLRSPTLNTFGLKKGIMAYIHQFIEHNPNIKINLKGEGEETPLPDRLSLALFRIVQESMDNVLRHSDATQVDITLNFTHPMILLRIADNGVGFDPPKNFIDLMRNGHYGIAGIAERVEMFGGDLKIDSNPGSGTVVEVTVNTL